MLHFRKWYDNTLPLYLLCSPHYVCLQLKFLPITIMIGSVIDGFFYRILPTWRQVTDNKTTWQVRSIKFTIILYASIIITYKDTTCSLSKSQVLNWRATSFSKSRSIVNNNLFFNTKHSGSSTKWWVLLHFFYFSQFLPTYSIFLLAHKTIPKIPANTSFMYFSAILYLSIFA